MVVAGRAASAQAGSSAMTATGANRTARAPPTIRTIRIVEFGDAGWRKDKCHSLSCGTLRRLRRFVCDRRGENGWHFTLSFHLVLALYRVLALHLVALTGPRKRPLRGEL